MTSVSRLLLRWVAALRRDVPPPPDVESHAADLRVAMDTCQHLTPCGRDTCRDRRAVPDPRSTP